MTTAFYKFAFATVFHNYKEFETALISNLILLSSQMILGLFSSFCPSHTWRWAKQQNC